MSQHPDTFDWARVRDPIVDYYQPAAPAAVADALPDADAVPLDAERPWPTGFAEWFAVSQTLLPAMLYFPGSQAYRLPLRVGAYAAALYAFFMWWFIGGARRPGKHPAERWLVLVTIVLVLSIFHPLTNSFLSGFAQTLLYLAIFCPLYWARGYVSTRRQLVRILLILLICNGINSLVGVLQVYDPDRWMPRELSPLFTTNKDMLGSVSYVGPGGRLIIRPPGLFDSPGAVCGAGTLAAVLGLIIALEPIAWWKRGLSIAMGIAGISAIYLSHVRVSFVVALGMMAAYVAMLAMQHQTKRVISFVALAGGLLTTGFTLAVLLGGQSVADRFATLFADDPRHLYYSSRGMSVEYAFTTLLTEYPLGAGLARWGMMRYYFGDPAKLDSTELFAEVQPNAWILDGGIFLLVFYSIALGVTGAQDVQLVRSLADREDRIWAAAVAAANLGTAALVFSFVPFGTAAGMQFWFLEGALHGAMANRPRLS